MISGIVLALFGPPRPIRGNSQKVFANRENKIGGLSSRVRTDIRAGKGSERCNTIRNMQKRKTEVKIAKKDN
jgi:hypothetical protein